MPGFPRDDAEALFAEWGYRDPLATVAEPFHLWVIEAPADVAAALPLAKAGANVVWTDDIRPYRERKVRLLNGTHTASALAAFLAGLDTVGEMIADPQFSRALHEIAFDEIAPYVPLPEAERLGYARSVLERFGNPFIRHELISIAFNSVSKWRVRILPTIRDTLADGKSTPPLLAFSLAALLWFYRGRKEGEGFAGRRAKGDYPIRDEPQVLAIMAEAWALEPAIGSGAVAARLMTDQRLWGADLTTSAASRRTRSPASRRSSIAAFARRSRTGSRSPAPEERADMPFQPIDSKKALRTGRRPDRRPDPQRRI